MVGECIRIIFSLVYSFLFKFYRCFLGEALECLVLDFLKVYFLISEMVSG